MSIYKAVAVQLAEHINSVPPSCAICFIERRGNITIDILIRSIFAFIDKCNYEFQRLGAQYPQGVFELVWGLVQIHCLQGNVGIIFSDLVRGILVATAVNFINTVKSQLGPAAVNYPDFTKNVEAIDTYIKSNHLFAIQTGMLLELADSISRSRDVSCYSKTKIGECGFGDARVVFFCRAAYARLADIDKLNEDFDKFKANLQHIAPPKDGHVQIEPDHSGCCPCCNIL